MRILCTNDDGIHAPGLQVVEQIARSLSDYVWIVAPELDQSGVSHSLSLNHPLRLLEVSPRHFAVSPDERTSVEFALEHLAAHAPRPAREISLAAGAPWGEVVVDLGKCTLCSLVPAPARNRP